MGKSSVKLTLQRCDEHQGNVRSHPALISFATRAPRAPPGSDGFAVAFIARYANSVKLQNTFRDDTLRSATRGPVFLKAQ